jgi:hypothetical protein
MTATLFLLGAALLGVGLSEHTLGSRISQVAHICFGLVIGWALTTAVAFGVARAAGKLSVSVLVLVMAASWLVAIYLWLPRLRSKSERLTSGPNASIKDYLPLLALLIVLAPLFIALFQRHMLQQGVDGALYSGGTSASYDIAFHTALTTSFVYGGNFPSVYPAMPPAPLLYPALPDFQTAVLVSLGLSLQTALVWTGVTLTLALAAIFYLFAFSLLSRSALPRPSLPWAAFLGTILFLFNGGFGFVNFIRDWGETGEFWSLLKTNYSNLPDQGIVWPNLIADTLLAQRTTLFGLSLAIMVFTLFNIAWRESDEPDREGRWTGWRVLLVAGLITGLLPGFHPHSFGAIGIVSGLLFLLRPRRVWLVFWAAALLLATPYLVPFLRHLAGEGFVRFRPGWRGPSDASWFLFWVRNAGLPTLLILPAWFAANRSLRLFYLPFAGLLVISLLVIFSPNDYDNLKLMTYWHAATVILVANWLVRLVARSPLLTIPVVLLVFASIASGSLALFYELRSRTLIFSRNEVAVAEFVRDQTSPRSLFLTGPSLHQPVLSLAGRAVVRGPTAWLWSHGYPFAEREADVRAIYAGRGDAVDLLRYYRVDYVYLGPRERQDLKANEDFFDRTFPVIYRDGDILVYDARGPGQKTDLLAPYPVREYASRVGLDPFQPLVEFRDVGYPLYRQLKVTLGRPPRYQEFMESLRILGRDVYPGLPGWRAVLDANRRKLADSWKVDDHRAPDGNEFNRAYVLLHYFGYLKRDVEADAEGYQFWLRDLDRTGDYRGLTRAFIESEEYKAQTP